MESTMDDTKKLEFVRRALHDVQAGELDIYCALIVIGQIVEPPEITQAALDWGRCVRDGSNKTRIV